METLKSKELAFAIRTLCSTLSDDANRRILRYAYETSILDSTPEGIEMYKKYPLEGETCKEVMESSYRHFQESQKNGGKHEDPKKESHLHLVN
jgi:hypothetical protein